MDMRGRGTLGSLSNTVSTQRGLHKNVPHALHGTRETLVPLGVVVLETNLKLDGLDEVALLLAVRLGEELTDGAPHACH